MATSFLRRAIFPGEMTMTRMKRAADGMLCARRAVRSTTPDAQPPENAA